MNARACMLSLVLLAALPVAHAATLRVDGEVYAQRSVQLVPPAVDRLWQFNLTQLAPDGSTVKKGDIVVAFDTNELVRQLAELTGEKKESTLRPKRTLFGGPGLVEIAARYEDVRFDDAGPDQGFEGAGNRASNIRPGGSNAIWAGVSWYPTRWARLYADLVWQKYDDELLAPEPPGAVGLDHEPHGRGTYTSLLARIQFFIP